LAAKPHSSFLREVVADRARRRRGKLDFGCSPSMHDVQLMHSTSPLYGGAAGRWRDQLRDDPASLP
jgi:hypothetical protein